MPATRFFLAVSMTVMPASPVDDLLAAVRLDEGNLGHETAGFLHAETWEYRDGPIVRRRCGRAEC